MEDGGRGSRPQARKAAPAAQERSLLRALMGLLATEHVCAPPDGAGDWRPVSEEAGPRGAGRIYVCPECGQHLARTQEAEPAR